MKTIKFIFTFLCLGSLLISCEAEGLTELTSRTVDDLTIEAVNSPVIPQSIEGEDDMPEPGNLIANSETNVVETSPGESRIEGEDDMPEPGNLIANSGTIAVATSPGESRIEGEDDMPEPGN